MDLTPHRLTGPKCHSRRWKEIRRSGEHVRTGRQRERVGARCIRTAVTEDGAVFERSLLEYDWVIPGRLAERAADVLPTGRLVSVTPLTDDVVSAHVVSNLEAARSKRFTGR